MSVFGNISSCPHNMVNFGPLAAEIRSGVWGTLANFNGFRVLASLLQRRRSPEANQTLHDVWPSPGQLQSNNNNMGLFYKAQNNKLMTVYAGSLWPIALADRSFVLIVYFRISFVCPTPVCLSVCLLLNDHIRLTQLSPNVSRRFLVF